MVELRALPLESIKGQNLKIRTRKPWRGILPILPFLIWMSSCSKNGGGAVPSSSEDVQAVTDSTFQKEVLASNEPVLVDFWATWCGPCRMFGPIVDQVAKDYRGRLKVCRVDLDQNPSLARTFNITAIPNSLLFEKGQLVHTWVGLVPEYELKDEIEKILDRSPPDELHS
jgi:thioredoxin